MDHAIDKPPTQRRQRGTLAIVCLATMILCLDIAVANSALPSIARDLHAGLGGVQWVVDAYTLDPRRVRAERRIDRRPPRAPTRVRHRHGAVHRGITRLRGVGQHPVPRPRPCRAGARRGDDVRHRAGDPRRTRSRSRASALARWPRSGRRSAPRSPSGRSSAGGSPAGWAGAAVFFVNIPLGLIALLGTFAWIRESRDPHAAQARPRPVRPPPPPGCSCSCSRSCGATPTAGASARTIAELAGAFVLGIAFVAIEQRAASPMLPLEMFKRRDFTAAQIAAFAISSTFFAIYLYVTLYLQNVLHLSPIDAGSDLPPGHDARVHRLRSERQAGRADQSGGAARIRPGDGRGRARSAHDDRRALVVDGDAPRGAARLARDRDLQSHPRAPRAQRRTARAQRSARRRQRRCPAGRYRGWRCRVRCARSGRVGTGSWVAERLRRWAAPRADRRGGDRRRRGGDHAGADRAAPGGASRRST